MKLVLIFSAILIAFAGISQTAEDHLRNGVTKHKNSDYTGAKKDYDKAIKLDKNYKDAYFNRGTCLLALENFKDAYADFSKVIELDPNYIKAYYSRAAVLIRQDKYADAMPDLDKTIALNPAFPNALTLRGQIRAQTGNKEGGCEDFQKAKDLGDQQADKFLNQFCEDVIELESLVLHWPEEENWKSVSNQSNEKIEMLELVRSHETLENWTEIGTMMSIKGAKNIPVDEAMNMMFEQSKKNSPKAVLTFIEKDENATYPWIIFTIESPNFKDDKQPESQLWYIVQGKHALYTNFRAVKLAKIPNDLKEKWIAFFKTGTIVTK